MEDYIQEYALTKKPSTLEKVTIDSSTAAVNVARKFYGADLTIYESMFVLYLDRANNTIGWVKLSQGGIVGTVCDIKLIAKYGVESLCSGCILIHNHPSGKDKPSGEDANVTRKAKDALRLLDITLSDHIILTEDSSYSFADNGAL